MPKIRTLFPALARALFPGHRPGKPRPARPGSLQRRRIRRRLRGLRESRPPARVERAELEAHIRQWSILQRGVSSDWYHAYLLSSGVQTRDYIPDDIYYYIVEPILNRRDSIPFLRNKGLNSLVWDADLLPATLIRRVAGFDYDDKFIRVTKEQWPAILERHDKVVVKPSVQSGGGRNVRIFRRTNGELASRDGSLLTRAFVDRSYGGDFIIQAFVEQHPYFAALNESSLNTFRVTTYRSVATDEIVILGHVIRIGQPGSEVDNHSAGGVSLDVDADGRPDTTGYTIEGGQVDRTPAGTPLGDLARAPHIDAVRRTAVEIAGKLVEQRMLGIDLCVDADGRVRLLEVNLDELAINLHQFAGNPLFGNYTAEVIEHCRARL